jgi:hypothetical protein
MTPAPWLEEIGEAEEPMTVALLVICGIAGELVAAGVCHSPYYWQNHCPEHTVKRIHHLGPFRVYNRLKRRWETIRQENIDINCDMLKLVTCGVAGFGGAAAFTKFCGG